MTAPTSMQQTDITGQSPELVIVSGMSGSGKSLALKTFEDAGYYCTDNLPARLVPQLIEALTHNDDSPQKLAVAIDVRSKATTLNESPQWLSHIGALGFDPCLLFFDASDAALLNRFSDTRRRHPLSHYGLALRDAIALERQAIKPLRQLANIVIDTSDLNLHQLRRTIITRLHLSQASTPLLLFESFAFKHGVPANADFVFDARVLPNPHWNPELRPLSSRDAAVQLYFSEQAEVQTYLQQVSEFLDTWLEKLRHETRSYVTIAIGCSGGRHRSVYLTEQLARYFEARGWPEVATSHRQID